MVKQWFSNSFVMSKRHLGILMIGVGLAVAVAMILVEVVGTNSTGLGMIQWLGIGGGAVSVLIGVTLLPLGEQLA